MHAELRFYEHFQPRFSKHPVFIRFWLFMPHSNFITHIPRKTLIQEANESN